MNTRFSFPKSEAGNKKFLEDYVTQEKLKSVERLLQHGNFELADLEIRVEPLAHGKGYSMRLNMKVKKHVLYAQEEGYDLRGVFDIALEKILSQLRKLESIKHDK